MSLLASTTTTCPVETVPDPTFADLPWYRCWLYHQIRNQPQRLLLALPNMAHDEESDWGTHFLPLWNKVRELVLGLKLKTIDGITDTLVEHGAISVEENYEAYQSAKELVFSTLGWQTMLYKPNILSYTTGEFNILDEMDGYHGEARVCLNQSSVSGKHDLPSFLLGFGMMLPPRHYCPFDDTDDRQLFEATKRIISKELNAHVLTKVCGVRLQWVDSLSCHLELDRHSGTLFLYRYPSFCVSSLQRQGMKERTRSAIHRCGFEEPGSVPWASEKDVTELLQEILLSYRLLFGQSRQSRSLFRRLQPFARIPQEGHDQFLSLICSRKQFDCPVTLIERDEYDVGGDFPHLRSRIVRLNSYASSKKPRSIRQLWQDKRDSTAWLALWSVLIFGSVSILLGLIQTVFQIMQYSLSLQQGGP
ncbi:dipeptidyl peptidase III [Fusarium albosuccineum]|uniref:Dipeptidyl peptidase III n=1 Tax=Fusarium albosuccineum TaxID=1237068 RepID=A0A8H4KYK9_9HYPO|nr:dipeptidyl peptidase III [Fusarium albosuccineum]